MYNSLGIQILQVSVCLSSAHEDDRLTCGVRHRNGSTHLSKHTKRRRFSVSFRHTTDDIVTCRHCLVLNTNLIVNRVELGQHDAVNKPRICHLRVIGERLVELHQLINSFVPDKCLAHEQHQVRLVHRDQLQAVQHDVIMTNLK